MFVVFSLAIPANADISIDKSSNNVTPMYEDPHLCHVGLQHENCEYNRLDEPCGCYAQWYSCCCGKIMTSHRHYCEYHNIYI